MAFYLCIFSGYSQSRVSGHVYIEDGTPAIGAVVLLSDKPDSSVTYQAIVRLDGSYEMAGVAAGVYSLHIVTLGYKDPARETAIPEGRNDLALDDITLDVTAEELTEVVVSGQRTQVAYEGNKATLNIRGTTLENALNPIEALTTLPGIESVDNGAVSVLGKGNVAIFLNGKRTNVSLNNIPMNIIKQVEVIGNPGAKYGGDIEVVINVITGDWDRNQLSVSTTAISSVARRKYVNRYLNQSISYTGGKWSTFLNGYVAHNNGFIDRQYYDEFGFSENNGTPTVRRSDEFRESVNKYYYLYNETSYQFTQKLSAGISLEHGVSRDPYTIDQTDEFFFSASPVRDSAYVVDSYFQPYLHENTAGLFLNFTSNSTRLDLESNYYHRRTTSDDISRFATITDESTDQNSIIKDQGGDSDIFSVRLNAEHTVSEKLSLSGGTKFSRIGQQNDNFFSGENDLRIPAELLFTSSEDVYAGYGSFESVIADLDIGAGLRIEYTDGRFRLDSEENALTAYNYTTLLPSGFINYRLSDYKSIRFSYSRKIDRASLYQRSPYFYYISPIYLLRGNPDLNNQTSHNLDLSLSIIEGLNMVAYYRDITDQLATLSFFEDNRYIARPENYDRQLLGFSVSNTLTPVSFWKTTNKLTLLYESVAGFAGSTPYAFDNYRYRLYSRNAFRIGENTSVQLNAWYDSPYYLGNIRLRFNPYMNLGLTRYFLNRNLKVGVDLTDVFWSVRRTAITDLPDQYSEVIRIADTRRIQLQMTWNLSKGMGKHNTKGINIIGAERNRL
ncbi:MAG: TonB-dependent receptor [Cyclobacteriaceae bacterium]